jgi:hypothetical protein
VYLGIVLLCGSGVQSLSFCRGFTECFLKLELLGLISQPALWPRASHWILKARCGLSLQAPDQFYWQYLIGSSHLHWSSTPAPPLPWNSRAPAFTNVLLFSRESFTVCCLILEP